ncbi:MAG: zinc ribbon domain-containing protein, partial [Deinococcus sp.]|nr:zinc ribbon domain-containing protein [Deinococcus sp.]
QAEKRTKAMWSAQHVHDIRRKRYDLPHIIFRSADGNQIPVPARPLVTAAEWTAAQRNQGRSGRYRTPEEYVLTGHLRCACGSRMQGSKSIYVRQDGTQRRFYVCKRRRGEVCPVHLVKAKTWPLDTIDAQAKVALASALRNPEIMGNLIGSSQPEPVHPEWAEEMDRLKRKQAALLDLYLEEAITRTDFDTRQAALKRRIGELEHMQIPRSRVAIDEAAAQRYAEAAERAGGARLAELLDVLNAEFTVKKSGEVILSRLSIPQ